MCKFLPKTSIGCWLMEDGSGKFSMEIAAALNRASLQHGLNVKKVAAWTGANERTVKNWFSGQYGPSGEHLVTLAKHCNEVLNSVLVAMGREDLLVVQEIVEMERRIVRLSAVLQELKSKSN